MENKKPAFIRAVEEKLKQHNFSQEMWQQKYFDKLLEIEASGGKLIICPTPRSGKSYFAKYMQELFDKGFDKNGNK